MLQGNKRTGTSDSSMGSPYFPNPLFLDFTFLTGFNVHLLQKQMYYGYYEKEIPKNIVKQYPIKYTLSNNQPFRTISLHNIP